MLFIVLWRFTGKIITINIIIAIITLTLTSEYYWITSNVKVLTNELQIMNTDLAHNTKERRIVISNHREYSPYKA